MPNDHEPDLDQLLDLATPWCLRVAATLRIPGLIADGQTFLSQDPGLVLIPSAVLCLTVLALNMAGDTLRRRHELGVRSSR